MSYSLPISLTLAKRAYNRVRPYLPKKIGVYAGVPVRSEALTDPHDHYPDYKRGLIEAIHDYINDGENVTLIGAGRGVSTVHCLRAGACHVAAYEAAESMVETARETLDMQNCLHKTGLQHALVGEAVEVYGDHSEAVNASPSFIEQSNVLVMDCEGAERSVLEGLGRYPPTVIVETHPERGVTTDVTRGLLDENGYSIETYEFEPDHPNEEKKVLVGVK